MDLCGQVHFSILFSFTITVTFCVPVYAWVREVGPIELAWRMVWINNYFRVGKFPFLFQGLCSLEVEDKLKTTVLEVGLGFGIGNLIITVLAKEF